MVKSVESREVSVPVLRSLSATAPEVSKSSTGSRTAEVEIAIEAERVAQEGKELDNEVKGYDDWGDATNEEIEEAMRNIDDWRKQLSKIQDRIFFNEEECPAFRPYLCLADQVVQFDGKPQGRNE